MRACLALGFKHGRFLFEMLPDLFPEGMVTPQELDLWGKYMKTLPKPKG